MTALTSLPAHRPNGFLVRLARNPSGALRSLAHHLARIGPAIAQHAIPLTVFGIAALALVVGALVAQRIAWRNGGHLVEIAPPSLPDPRGGLALWRMLSPLLTSGRAFGVRRPPVVFECVADEGGLAIGLWVSKTLSADSIAGAVESAWPGARTRVGDARVLPVGRVAAGRARLGAPEWFALGGTEPKDGDPLRAVLAALAEAGSGGVAIYAVAARPASGRRVSRARRAALALRRGEPTGATNHLGSVRSLVSGAPAHRAGRTTTDPLALIDVRDVTTKVNDGPHFEVAVHYGIVSSDVVSSDSRTARRLRRRRLREIAGALGLFTGRNRLVCRYVLVRSRMLLSSRRLGRAFLCSAPELAALAHLPAEPSAYGMAAAPARTVSAPRDVTTNA
jgi:hypothetical protein